MSFLVYSLDVFSRFLKGCSKMNPEELKTLLNDFKDGWPYFLKCIDFNLAHLDARAIQFFNEMPSRIIVALMQAKHNAQAIQDKNISEGRK